MVAVVHVLPSEVVVTNNLVALPLTPATKILSPMLAALVAESVPRVVLSATLVHIAVFVFCFFTLSVTV